MKSFEVELRSFISKYKYNELVASMMKNAKLLDEINDETVYLEASYDLRIRHDDKKSYIILKSGKIHDNKREEIELGLDEEDYKKIQKLFLLLGHKAKISWKRRRKIFLFEGAKVFLDSTIGYGHIIEIEKITNSKNKSKCLNEIKELFIKLNLIPTPKSVQDEKYNNYLKKWGNH